MAPPYGAAVPGARALALDVAAEGQRPGNRAPRVSDETVTTWLEQGGAIVAGALTAVGGLPATPGEAKPGQLDQETVGKLAGHLVELYAAGLLADVTHPERVRDGRGYGQALTDRFDRERDRLADSIDASLKVGADQDPDAPGYQGGGAEAVFPPALLTRTIGF